MTSGALVVDDDPVSRRILMALLSRAGQRVVCASDGPEALSIVETFAPSLACVDLNMPGMSGLELVEALRSRLGTEMPQVVMLTASGDPGDASRAKAAGIDRYLTKPVGSQDVANFLHELSLRAPKR